MSVTVYEMAHSPYCIPITAALRACGVEFSTREVPNWDRSELLRLTDGAYYQVPLLEHDGRLIFESGADTLDVARYVDATFAARRLFPAPLEGLQAIVVDHLENEVEARTFKLADIHYVPAIEDVAARGMVVRHKERRFGRGCVEQWRANAAQLRVDADALLARFEATVRHTPFLLGNAPVYADFALYGIVGNFTYRRWNALSPDQHALAAWRERLAAWRFA
jgi:glutathione S-transferase